MKFETQSQLSRRSVLQAGVAAGVAASLPGLPAWAAAPAPILRAIPSSGEKLPVIGVGTNAFGVNDAAERAALKDVLRELPAQGGKLIDTAFGYGTSEVVIGELLKELGNRDKVFLATKTPLQGQDISGGKAVLDQSFKRLQVETLDLLQIHNLWGLEELMPFYREYKQAGKIRYIGVTTSVDNQYEGMLAAMHRHKFDFIQVDYSIDNRGSAERILPMARDMGIGVIINVPFGGRRGSVFPRLAGKPLPDFAKDIDATSWAQYMLKYILANPAVSVVIPGTTTVAHLQDNQQGGRGRLPDAALLKRMEEHWASL
jgi:aryl-alcohol dehydrogenase-like predicted oxidoreductase